MNTPNTMLPPQSAPIDRTPAGAAAQASQAGVEASFPWEELASTGVSILGGLI